MNTYRPKLTTTLWLMLMLLLLGLGSRLIHNPWLETGFLALLPQTEQQPDTALAIQKHNELRDRKLIWIVGGGSPEGTIQNARFIAQRLRQSHLFKTVTLEVSSQHFRQQYQQLFPYRYQLLDRESQRQISTDPKAYLAKNLGSLHSPIMQMQVADIEHDPLSLFGRYFKAQNPIELNLWQDIVFLQDENSYWALIQTELVNNNLQLDKLENLLAYVNYLRTQALEHGGDLLVTGMPLFTAAGADSAKQEISTVGLGSSLGIIAVLLLTFRSPRPLLLSFLAIGSGLLAALVVSVLVFGKIHIITLVFGASLIGVADDYALHFVCDSFSSKDWQPKFGLKHIFFGLLVGLITNLLSYVGLMFSSFPGLQEVAVFSVIGLCMAWLTVVWVFPLLLTGFNPGHQPILFKLADYWQQHWPSWLIRQRRWLIPLAVVFILGGLWQLKPRDDVRLLQSASPELITAAEKIKQLLPITPENQFFLVSGRDIDDWHHNEQRLLAQLDSLTQQNKLKAFQGLSKLWSNASTQRDNYQLLKKTFYQSGLLKQYMADLSFNQQAIADEIKHFKAAENQSIALSDWLKLTDTNTQALWLGCDANRCLSRVTLSGLSDLTALSSLKHLPGVAWVDQVNQLSDLFQRCRTIASVLIAASYLLVFIGLALKFGGRKSLTIIAIPITAALVSLAMSGWCGQLFSLFNLFALLLVLGIGVDDAVFFAMTGHADAHQLEAAPDLKRGSTALAVTLSALTTLLAFGLLAVSATEVVHAFGFTVGIGILTAFLCSPLVGFNKDTAKA